MRVSKRFWPFFRSLLDRDAASRLIESDAGVSPPMDPAETAGTVIGRYRLLQKVGEGGMGEAWLAEQTEPVRRRVAVKLVKAGMNSREVIARFESERQALALMDHPAIAKVFDAGSTPQGVPYFVMEYVAGVPITAYCDNHRLGTRDRLKLFMHVCEGVQHAHRKAIIHRDLKPSNILVTEVDGQPAPKIIDFGVAKALTQKLTADTMFTRVGALVGTPEYVSPEQALSSGEDIDTRSDVYSLGIVFYELLAGAPPIQLGKIAFDEFLRRLREEDPPKPSTRIRTEAPATLTELARKRQSEPPALAGLMRGDLDSIAMKALQKDRARRYGSPADFAADIGRYLNHEAVLAVPPSYGYRTRKFARRHRGPLIAASAFSLVLVAAAGVSVWQGIRANREAAVAEAVNDFLQDDLLAQASAPNQQGIGAKPDPDLKVRTALDRAAGRIGGKFQSQPAVEASIRDTIGQTYIDLGLYPEAQKQLERALDLERRLHGIENPKTLRTMSRLGFAAFSQGNLTQAAQLCSRAFEIQRRVLGAEHPDTLASMNGLANAYYAQGNYAEAAMLDSRTLEMRRRVLGPQHRDTLSSMTNLAVDYQSQGKIAEAGALDGEALEIERRLFGPEHPDTLTAMNNFAGDLYLQGKYAQAEQLYAETLEIRRRVLGAEHALTLSTVNNLADVYGSEGKFAQAAALLDETLKIRRRVLGAEHPSTLDTLADAADIYQRQGDYALAAACAAQALSGRRHALGPEHPETIQAAASLALAYLSQGKFAEAQPLAREALEFNKQKQPDDWRRFRAGSLLGASLAGQGKYAEAEPLLLEGFQGMAARKERMAVPDCYYLDRAHDWIVRLYEAWGKPAKAAQWMTK